MIKLETHCHIRGLSHCADGDDFLMLTKYKKAGYSGIVAVSHYSKDVCEKYYKGKTYKEKIDYFFKTYDDFSSLAKSYDIKTFCGAEVRLKKDGQEYMILGFDRKFLYDNELYNLTQEELFKLAEKHGVFVYQTHPFRDGVLAGNPIYLHGAEGFNGHYHHDNHNEKAQKFCEDNNLISLSGTDYHHDDQPVTAGIYIPKEIQTDKQLVEFILKNKFNIIANM